MNIEELAFSNVIEDTFTILVDAKPSNKIESILMSLGLKSRKRRFEIKPMSLGTKIRFSKYVSSIDLAATSDMNIIEATNFICANHMENIVNALASIIHNKDTEPPESLKKFILDNFTTNELSQIVLMAKENQNVEVFINSIISMTGVSLRKPTE